ncbi:MAG: HD domain-containing protein, partial [Clostridiales Family XIII bacterium]|nr:HD domain-containing protein [Clostridiales Family XIII bacterium]
MDDRNSGRIENAEGGRTLDRADCLALLKEHGTPDNVIEHCVSVADVALRLARALNAAIKGSKSGSGEDRPATPRRSLDTALAERAALLHDIARVHPHHAKVGADIVAAYDRKAASIIADHMTHDFPDSLADICESDIVSLADRSVYGDRCIGFRARMGDILERFSDNPQATASLRRHLDMTERFVGDIERFVGRSVDDIADGGVVPVMSLLKRVERPSRYIGGEIHTARKDPETVRTRFCFAFPDLYEIGMSYTGLQILYAALNEMSDVYCERAFAPAPDMEALLIAEGLPLFTLETHTDLKRMDI